MEAVPEDWERALTVVAHPDDLEYGTSAAIAKWTSQGKTVTEVLATRGRFALFSGSPRAAHYTDVTGHLQAGIDSLLAHRVYFATLGADFDAAAVLTGAAEESGRAAGVQHATTFEMIES